MKSKTTFFTILFLFIFLSTASQAYAWVKSGNWSSNNVNYHFGYIADAFKSPTNFGANAWTNVTSSSWTWVLSSSGGAIVQMGTIDGSGGTAANTMRTITNGIITAATITYDIGENWYYSSGTPASNQIDARSIAAHELGHGLGLSHTTSNYCPAPPSTSMATMCSGYYPGSTYKRSLESDDRNGVSNIYP
jgi:hypothetical protein